MVMAAKILLVSAWLVAAISLVTIASFNNTAGALADDAIYLLMADWFGGLVGHSVENSNFVWPVAQFPPVYPMVLGFLGGTTAHLAYAHAITATFSVLGAYVAYKWMRANNSLSAVSCLTVAVWWLMLPKTTFSSVEAMSEPLYVLLTFVALVLYERPRDHDRYDWLLVFCVVLTALTRTIGIALVIAFLIAHWRSKRRYRIATFVGVLTPICLWGYLSATFFYGERVYVGEPLKYFSANSVTGIFHTMFVRWPGVFWEAWVGQFMVSVNPIVRMLCTVILAGALIGFTRRLIKLKIDSIYVGLYLVILWFWPYLDHIHRFIWPLMPLLLFVCIFICVNCLVF